MPTLRALQHPLAGVEAREHPLLAQLVERERDLAAVVGAEEVHDLRKIFGPALERLPGGLVARRCVADAAREGTAVLDRVGLTGRAGQIEAELGDGAIAVGIGIGLLLALGAGQLLQGLLYGVDAVEPLVFVTAPVILLASSLLASYIPALRATKVDPTVALRSE